MNATEQASYDFISDSDLQILQKRTAQRADELLRLQGGSRGNDLELWLQAEREVLESNLSHAE